MSTLSTYHDVLNQKRALHPDPGTESDLEVEDNEFALSPGQFLKRFIPKSSGAFSALGGLSRREKGLRTGLRARLSVDEAHLHDAATSEQATALHSADSPATTTAKFELTPTIGRPGKYYYHFTATSAKLTDCHRPSQHKCTFRTFRSAATRIHS